MPCGKQGHHDDEDPRVRDDDDDGRAGRLHGPGRRDRHGGDTSSGALGINNPANSACDTLNRCASGLVCRSGDGTITTTCLPPGQNGDWCSSKSDCATGLDCARTGDGLGHCAAPIGSMSVNVFYDDGTTPDIVQVDYTNSVGTHVTDYSQNGEFNVSDVPGSYVITLSDGGVTQTLTVTLQADQNLSTSVSMPEDPPASS